MNKWMLLVLLLVLLLGTACNESASEFRQSEKTGKGSSKKTPDIDSQYQECELAGDEVVSKIPPDIDFRHPWRPEMEVCISSIIEVGLKWNGIPPLVGDDLEYCRFCKDRRGVLVHRAPFNFIEPSEEHLVIDSGSALAFNKLKLKLTDCFLCRLAVEKIYRRTLEEMQAVSGDSAYFTGEIMFKLEIAPEGSVKKLQILSSSTNMPEFDQEIVNSLKFWLKFPKAEGKTVVTFPYRFVKTKYPRGYVEMYERIHGSI